MKTKNILLGGALILASALSFAQTQKATNLDVSNNLILSKPTLQNLSLLGTDAAGNIIPGTNTALSPTLSSANIFVGNASNVATGVGVTGDISILNTGATTIGVGAVTTAKILDGTILFSDLAANGATTAGQIISWNGTAWALAPAPVSANIYTANGDLIAARTVGLNGNNLTYNIGNVATGTPGVTFTSDGKLGILTPAPIADLGFGTGANRTIGINPAAANTGGNALIIRAGNAATLGANNLSGGALVLQSGIGVGTGGSSIFLNTATPVLVNNNVANTLTTKMTILGNGNVGIGTTTPNGTLQFANTDVARRIVFRESANNNHQFTGIGLLPNQFNFQVNNAANNFTFGTGTSATSSNELMRIKGNGEVSGVAGLAVVYDLKYGLQNGDHNGWYLLNGRTCAIATTVGTNARTRCTTKWGAGAMPNANNANGAFQNSATYFGNIDGNTGTVAGTIGGDTDNLWGSSDLPNLSHDHPYIYRRTNSRGNNGNDDFMINSTSSGTTSSSNPGGTLALVPTSPRTMDANAFVYLGL